MQVKKSIKICFVTALMLCFISMLGAHLVQSDVNTIKIKDMRIETPLGRQLSFLLFIPENATKDNKAPAIVTSHGWYNNREMQDINYVELARRGYVVASIDMYGHGNSDPLPTSEIALQGTGMYDVVEILANLPYVDKSKIGVTGHSNGARAANFSIDIDNEKEIPLISSVLLIGNDANYYDANKNFYNKYGSRDVGIIAALYDEFFFRIYKADKSVTPPREYIFQDTAQSFLNFGLSPENEAFEAREASVFYTQNIDTTESLRIIYTPDEIHPYNHFSKNTVQATLEFFQTAMPAPKALSADNQVWQYKAMFNALGLLGFALFVLSFTKIMLRTSFFSSLISKQEVTALESEGLAAQLWFYASLILSVVFSAVSYVYLFSYTRTLTADGISHPLLMQAPVFFIGTWSVLCALFTLALFFIGSLISKNKTSFAQRGIDINISALFKTILLSILVVFCAYGLVFTADILFKADFRLWILPLKAFTNDKFPLIAMYLPFFAIFYVINSIAINCFNYIKGLPEILNIILLALVNGLSAILLIYVQYTTFLTDGRALFEVMFGTVSFNIIGIWLFPIAIYLPLSALFTRAIFKDTKNPYLGAFIMALIVTIAFTTNTLTHI